MTEHPEDARLAAAGPREVTLYTRPGCHLCEDAKEAILPLLHEFGAELREVNIENDAVLEGRYGLDIPVILLARAKPRSIASTLSNSGVSFRRADWVRKNPEMVRVV